MTILQATGLDRVNPAQGGVRGMRIVASGLLVIMAALYLFARAQEAPGASTGWGYLRAFAEAAMVGGLARILLSDGPNGVRGISVSGSDDPANSRCS